MEGYDRGATLATVEDLKRAALGELPDDPFDRARKLDELLLALEHARSLVQDELGAALADAHDRGFTWQAVADEMGMDKVRAWQLGTKAGSHPYRRTPSVSAAAARRARVVEARKSGKG